MERFAPTFLVAAVVTFILGTFLQGIMPVMTLSDVPVKTLKEVAMDVPDSFYQLEEDYPEAFKKHFGRASVISFREALDEGRNIYIAEGCWHCHSQFVRPVSNEEIRFGPVSTAQEYQSEMHLPQLLGTRRVGPDLIRSAGVHSNDWHVAHLYDPRSVSPYSVMPAYPWFFDGTEPNRKGLAMVAYLQWLGSWIEEGAGIGTSIYNADALSSTGPLPAAPAAPAPEEEAG